MSASQTPRPGRGRRAAGEGSISSAPRKDGRWEGSIDVGWRDGRRVRKRVYGATQREVAVKLAAVRRQIEQGVEPAPERLTVARFLKDWLAAVEPTLRPATSQRYREVVDVHLIPALGRHRLAQLRPQHVEILLATKARAPRTRQANIGGG